jgi:hypothetical protein
VIARRWVIIAAGVAVFVGFAWVFGPSRHFG